MHPVSKITLWKDSLQYHTVTPNGMMLRKETLLSYHSSLGHFCTYLFIETNKDVSTETQKSDFPELQVTVRSSVQMQTYVNYKYIELNKAINRC